MKKKQEGGAGLDSNKRPREPQIARGHGLNLQSVLFVLRREALDPQQKVRYYPGVLC